MPIVRTHQVSSAPVLPRCRQTRKILPQSRFREPFCRNTFKFDRLYRTIPQSLRDSSLYTREPFPSIHPRALTARKIPIWRTEERYRAAQGRNDYTYLAHDLAARPAGKFQFFLPIHSTGRGISGRIHKHPRSFSGRNFRRIYN